MRIAQVLDAAEDHPDVVELHRRAAEWIACLQGRADFVSPHALLAEVHII